MFEALEAISAEDGISKSSLVRGLMANLMISRIERRMVLGLNRRLKALIRKGRKARARIERASHNGRTKG